MRICFHYRVNFYKTAGANLTLRRNYSVCHRETPDKESSSFAKFYKIESLSRVEDVREFLSCAWKGYMTFSEMLDMANK